MKRQTGREIAGNVLHFAPTSLELKRKIVFKSGIPSLKWLVEFESVEAETTFFSLLANFLTV